MAMTTGPDMSTPDSAPPVGWTAATGVITACTDGAALGWNRGAAAPTAPTNTNGVITAKPNAGRARLCACWRTVAVPVDVAVSGAGRTPRRPPMRTQPSSDLGFRELTF